MSTRSTGRKFYATCDWVSFDVVVGVNLLREGLDLPEVTLVAILDADKEGFLRSETSLIQTIGRAARNIDGVVLLYGDKITNSMEKAIEITNRRREIQRKYNEEHGTSPTTILKEIRGTVRSNEAVAEVMAQYNADTHERVGQDGAPMRIEDIPILIGSLEKDMKDLAKLMEFEKAARVRDEIVALRAMLGTSTGHLGQGKRHLPKAYAQRR